MYSLPNPPLAVGHDDLGRAYAASKTIQPSYATDGLPDPSATGPCQLQASPFCLQVGGQVMDPMDMLETETAFRGYTQSCTPCYEARADLYVATLHGRV